MCFYNLLPPHKLKEEDEDGTFVVVSARNIYRVEQQCRLLPIVLILFGHKPRRIFTVISSQGIFDFTIRILRLLVALFTLSDAAKTERSLKLLNPEQRTV